MRVAVVSHTYVLEANRGKFKSLAGSAGIELLLVAPMLWKNRDIGQVVRLEPGRGSPFQTIGLRAWSLGWPSVFIYEPLSLFRCLSGFQPHVIQLEEEPWSVAALEVSVVSAVLNVPLVFFTWENVDRWLPWPLRLIRRLILRRARGGIAGSAEAMSLLRRHGFPHHVSVLPQLGVDASVFRPGERASRSEGVVVGYVGRLVRQKGLLVLLEAVARLQDHVRLLVVGSGPLKGELIRQAAGLRLSGRFELCDGVRHVDVPQYLNRMSVLVLPSLTTSTWKEQFGHVLIEAMACGVPVIGSDSGAIPEVIGDAGLVVREGDVAELTSTLRRLLSDPGLREELSARGRARVLWQYTDNSIALRLAAVWQTVLSDA